MENEKNNLSSQSKHLSREIKFRAWEEGCGMLKTPQSVLTALSWHLRAVHFTTGERYSKNPEYIPKYNLMQFTGIKDYDGKEIYEGDLLDFRGYTFLVEFKYGQFMATRERLDNVNEKVKDMNDLRNFVDGGKVTIIGNIYENPELLKNV